LQSLTLSSGKAYEQSFPETLPTTTTNQV